MQKTKDFLIRVLGGVPMRECGELIFCATQVTLLAERALPPTFFYLKECKKVIKEIAPSFARNYFKEAENG